MHKNMNMAIKYGSSICVAKLLHVSRHKFPAFSYPLKATATSLADWVPAAVNNWIARVS